MGFSRTTPLRRRARKRRRQLAGRPLRAVAHRSPAVLRTVSKHTPRAVKHPPWKLVGLAGIAGVAATGVVVARHRRAHRDLPPDELRERLHKRLAEVAHDPAGEARADGPPAAPAPPG